MNKQREELIKNYSELSGRSKEQIQQLLEIFDWNETEVLQIIVTDRNQIDLLTGKISQNPLNLKQDELIYEESDEEDNEEPNDDQINVDHLFKAQNPNTNSILPNLQKQQSLPVQNVRNIENNQQIPKNFSPQKQQSDISNERPKYGIQNFDHKKLVELKKKEEEEKNISLQSWKSNQYSNNNQQGIDQSQKKVQIQPPLPQSNLNQIQNFSQQNQSNINNNLGPRAQQYDNPNSTSLIQNNQKIIPQQIKNVIPNPNFEQPNQRIANPSLQATQANEQQNKSQISQVNPLFKSADSAQQKQVQPNQIPNSQNLNPQLFTENPKNKLFASQPSQIRNDPKNQNEQNKKIEVVPQINKQQLNDSNKKQNEQSSPNKNQIDKQPNQNQDVTAYFQKINSNPKQPFYQVLESLRNLKDEDIDIDSFIQLRQFIQNSDDNENFYPIGFKNEQQQSSFNCILQLIFRNPMLIDEILNSYKKDSVDFLREFNYLIANFIWKTSNSCSDVSKLLQEIRNLMSSQLRVNQQQDYFLNQSIIEFFENFMLQIDDICCNKQQISKKYDRFQNQTLINQYQASRLGSQLQYISYIELERSDRFFYISLIREVQQNQNFSALPANLIFSIKDPENLNNDYWFPTQANLQFLKMIDKATPIIQYLQQSCSSISQVNEHLDNLNAINFVAKTYQNSEVIYQDVISCLENEMQIISEELTKFYPKNFKKINQQFNKDLPDWYFLQAIVIQIEEAYPLYYIYIFSFLDNRWQKFYNDSVVYVPHNQVMKDAQKNACMLVYVSKEQKIKITEYEENLKAIFLEIKQEISWKQISKKHLFLQHKIFKEIFKSFQQ